MFKAVVRQTRGIVVVSGFGLKAVCSCCLPQFSAVATERSDLFRTATPLGEDVMETY